MRRVTQLVDDLDGGPAAETVRFGLDGAGYELDLSPKNAAALRAVLGRYVAAARRVNDSAPVRPVRRLPLAAVATEPAPEPAVEPAAAPAQVEPVRLVSAVPPEPIDPAPVVRPVIGLNFSDRHSNGSANG